MIDDEDRKLPNPRRNLERCLPLERRKEEIRREKEREREIHYTYDAQQSMGNYCDKYMDKSKITSSPSKERLKYSKVFFSIILIVLLLPITILLITNKSYDNSDKKSRTFMIYMVGSDLESKSMQGTYSINEIVGNKIDLKNNNILLMVGGSKKWHNFVKSNELAVYELTNEGFEKKQENELVSMGSSETLTNYLNYAYEEYPAENYDLIFWNHGLGAIGLEHDEIAEDFIAIDELDTALKNSKFNDKKLELAIFYNCLTENLHVANIMSNYSNYMLGSEEIIYLSKVFNRFSFFEKINKNDTVYDIAKYFIDLSDSYIDDYNKTHNNKINSTLSLIDLNKLKQLETDLDSYTKSIELTDNYFDIAKVRRNLYTYGKSNNNDFDTVDLYSLVEALRPYSSKENLINTIKNDINDLVVINSSDDNYSNGLAVYFPYFNNYDAIDTHLTLFEKMWKTSSYIDFIKTFNDIRFNYYRSKRSTGNTTNKLTNNIQVNNDLIEIDLSEEESKIYQEANIYIFNKNTDNKYELLLQSNNVVKNNNKLTFKYDGLLQVDNNYISFIDKDNKTIYGNIANSTDSLDTIFNIKFNDNNGVIEDTILDSGNYPLSSIVDIYDYNILSLSRIKYDLFEDNMLKENWKENYIKENIEYQNYINNIEIKKDKKSLKDLYIMIEMYDVNNDTYYSSIMKVV